MTITHTLQCVVRSAMMASHQPHTDVSPSTIFLLPLTPMSLWDLKRVSYNSCLHFHSILVERRDL